MFIILMATYNGEQYIKEQIDSILEQSYEDWFLLISDDGSEDGTMHILNQYLDAFPKKIQVITNKGKEHGARANFNNCITYAPEGDYYAFCDQDDVWDKDKLKILLEDYEKLDNSMPQLIYHEIAVVSEDLRVLGEHFSDYSGLHLNMQEPFHALLLGNYIPGCSISFNRALKKIMKPTPEDARMHDWWTILIGAAFGQLHKEEKTLLLYRQHRDNTIGVSKILTRKQVILNSLLPKQFIERLLIAKKLKSKGYRMSKVFLEKYGDMLSVKQKDWVEKNIVCMKNRHGIISLYKMIKYKNYWSDDIVRSIVYWFVRI